MSRSVPEWHGKTDDSVPPPHVRVRVFDRCKGLCHRCGRLIRAGERWVLEHLKAIINGGANAEFNLGLSCCNCIAPKNAEDVAEKSAVYQKRMKHLGVKPKGRGFQKAPPGYNHWTRRVET